MGHASDFIMPVDLYYQGPAAIGRGKTALKGSGRRWRVDRRDQQIAVHGINHVGSRPLGRDLCKIGSHIATWLSSVEGSCPTESHDMGQLSYLIARNMNWNGRHAANWLDKFDECNITLSFLEVCRPVFRVEDDPLNAERFAADLNPRCRRAVGFNNFAADRIASAIDNVRRSEHPTWRDKSSRAVARPARIVVGDPANGRNFVASSR